MTFDFTCFAFLHQDVSAPRESAKWQYEGTQAEGMMFNTDFALYYDIVTNDNGEPICHNPYDCTVAFGTYPIAEGYANVRQIQCYPSSLVYQLKIKKSFL